LATYKSTSAEPTGATLKPFLSNAAKAGLTLEGIFIVMKKRSIPIDLIREALKIDATSRTGLRWKFRPRHHFLRESGWRYFNARDSGKEAGCIIRQPCGKTYFLVSVKNRQYFAHRIIVALINGVDPGDMEIDHIDGDGTNNNPQNLRLATPAQNCRNRLKNKNNNSGKKGVAWHRQRQKWQATIRINGRQAYLGLFKDINEASAVYEAAAREHFGEFYREGANA
jgi:hypothetical protein